VVSASLKELALVVVSDWSSIDSSAKPYLAIMLMLESVNDVFGENAGHEIVRSFLGHAKQWRGSTARAVKLELAQRSSYSLH
jgi:hypothetical protein